ncbi:MAG: hypothetical protein HC898_10970 [Phycisphaerales bacterium]|nr:hypothetical protein [Phycisphaerales bacterium]
MIFNQVELHNVAETQPWGSGHILYRYPVNVRAKLNPRGRFDFRRELLARRFALSHPHPRAMLYWVVSVARWK